MTLDATLDAMRDLIQADPGERGLARDPAANLLTVCRDDFGNACRSFADPPAPKALVVTGFHIAHVEPPCAETDGPLGALFLARALTPIGVEVVLAADGTCVPALHAGLEACGLTDRVTVLELPLAWDDAEFVDWMFGACDLPAAPLTHLIALERVGPGHTVRSLKAQPGATPEMLAEFNRLVPPADRGRARSMRGRDLTAQTSPAHLLFEAAAGREPPLTTIGIGDGGNEIGMGKVPWGIIRRNISDGGLIACRVPTDHLIVAGVSNWGAYALAAGVRLVREAAFSAPLFDVETERGLLRRMVEEGPLVDGRSGTRTATVDGLSFEQYAEVLPRLAALLPGPEEG
jgi:hypothetical protein